MQTVYIGNTLINDVMLGSQRMDDVIAQQYPLTIDWLLVGGGGGGGTGTGGTRQGGSGGAGRFVSSSFTNNAYSIPITIGAAGTGTALNNQYGGDGGQSSFVYNTITYTAPGGGGGGKEATTTGTDGDGRAGGSGGGAGSHGLGTGAVGGGSNQVGSPIEGFGSNGESLSDVNYQTTGGKGGGAGGLNTGYVWLDGDEYAKGGPGASSYGSGGGGNTGASGSPSAPGIVGIVKIRYSGTPKATGGTITQSGGYTYHTFTSNGTFTY